MKQLHQIPDTKCILSVLRQLPEIRKITVRSEGDTKTGNRPSMDKVIYEGNGFWVQLVVRIDEHGKTLFIQNHLTSSHYKLMYHDETEKTRAVMKAVEAKLVSQCGMKELMSGIEEEAMK